MVEQPPAPMIRPGDGAPERIEKVWPQQPHATTRKRDAAGAAFHRTNAATGRPASWRPSVCGCMQVHTGVCKCIRVYASAYGPPPAVRPPRRGCCGPVSRDRASPAPSAARDHRARTRSRCRERQGACRPGVAASSASRARSGAPQARPAGRGGPPPSRRRARRPIQVRAARRLGPQAARSRDPPRAGHRGRPARRARVRQSGIRCLCGLPRGAPIPPIGGKPPPIGIGKGTT